jgi:hypothetical protein
MTRGQSALAARAATSLVAFYKALGGGWGASMSQKANVYSARLVLDFRQNTSGAIGAA